MGDIYPHAWKDMKQVLASGQPQIGKRVAIDEANIIANRTAIRHHDEIIGVLSIFQDAG
jgi:sensor histidine kinase regulating citrate/malate metabolism